MNKIDIFIYVCLILLISLLTLIGSLAINLVAITIIYMILIKQEKSNKGEIIK